MFLGDVIINFGCNIRQYRGFGAFLVISSQRFRLLRSRSHLWVFLLLYFVLSVYVAQSFLILVWNSLVYIRSISLVETGGKMGILSVIRLKHSFVKLNIVY